MADNHLTLERAVMVASIMDEYDINFDRCIIREIHERAFRLTTTIPFLCLIYRLCMDSGVPIISGEDQLIKVTRIQDVGLIKHDTNPVAQRRAPQLEVRTSKLFEVQAVAQGSEEPISGKDNPAMESSVVDTTTATPPSTSMPCPHPAGLVTISAELLQNLVQRHTHIES